MEKCNQYADNLFTNYKRTVTPILVLSMLTIGDMSVEMMTRYLNSTGIGYAANQLYEVVYKLLHDGYIDKYMAIGPHERECGYHHIRDSGRQLLIDLSEEYDRCHADYLNKIRLIHRERSSENEE